MDAPTFTTRCGTAWYVNIIGGTQMRGRWKMARDMIVVSILGGANLDYTEVEFADPEAQPTLTKVSLVGGVSLQVPSHIDVEVEGFRLFGGASIEPASRTGAAHTTLKVRAFGLAGGVSVERTN